MSLSGEHNFPEYQRLKRNQKTFRKQLALQEAVQEAVDQIIHWADRFDCMVIGPGLGRDELVHDTVKEVCCLARALNEVGLVFETLISVVCITDKDVSISNFSFYHQEI